MPVRPWLRLRFGDPVIVVSGLPRSGTSMAMRMLAAGGMPVVTDGERDADADNPVGYFELERVKDLERAADRSWVRGLRGQAVKVISYLLRYLPATNRYRVIFVRRDLGEVLASQRKMLVRRGEAIDGDDASLLRHFGDHLWRTRWLLTHDRRFELLELDYADVVADPLGNARRMGTFLHRPLDIGAMAAAVDPSLYRNRRPAPTGS